MYIKYYYGYEDDPEIYDPYTGFEKEIDYPDQPQIIIKKKFNRKILKNNNDNITIFEKIEIERLKYINYNKKNNLKKNYTILI